jgi:nitrilase
MTNTFKAAVIQGSPALFDRKKTVKKMDHYIQSAAKRKPKLILFPEAFIPAYPWGLTFGTKLGGRTPEGRRTWRKYVENAVEVPGPEVTAIGKMAAKAKAFIAVGVIEKDTHSQGTVYCSLLYFGPDGKYLGKHRKLKPTAGERIIWGEGDGTTLTVLDTKLGRIGGLICWENYMPLARMAMYSKGVQIYLAPTADHRESWVATMQHIACEGRCYVLGCNQFVTKDMYPEDLEIGDDLKNSKKILCRGGSVIVDPLGNILAGPLWDKEGILYAEIALEKTTEAKMDFDVTGHYSRNDVFTYSVHGMPEIIRVK